MTVNFYATLRPIVGGKHVEIDLGQAATVRDLVAAITLRHPQIGEKILDEEGKLGRHVHVFVNGRSAVFLEDGLATRISASDEIDVFPAVAGGCRLAEAA